MALVKGLAAAAALALSVSAVAACDDYSEEMAMIAAKRAVAEAKAERQQAVPEAQVASQVQRPGAVQATSQNVQTSPRLADATAQ